MPLAWFLVLLLIIGAALALFPSEPTIKKVVIVFVVILAIVAMLQFFGVLQGGPRIITGSWK